MSGDREAQFQAIMARILSGGQPVSDEYNPMSDVNALVRERIERRQRGDAAPDPLRGTTPPSVKGGEHGEP